MLTFLLTLQLLTAGPGAVPVPEGAIGPQIRPVTGPEVHVYNVYVFGAHSGIARLEAKRGREVIYARGKVDSAGLLDSFYPVHNEALSVIDRETFLPRKYVMETDERQLLSRYLLYFTPEKARFTRIKTRKRPSRFEWRDFQVRGYGAVQDMVSSLMFLRSRRLDDGQRGRFFGYSGNYLYEIKYRVVGRGQTYTELGILPGVAVMAAVRRWDARKRQVSGDGWSKEVRLWFSDDERHLPLAIEVNLFVGAVRVVLSKIE